MGNRLKLQTSLETILDSRQVYFQPPESVRMSYPAIVYDLDGINTEYADDKVYSLTKSYQIILMDRKSNHYLIDKIIQLHKCSFIRSYTANNLNHFVFRLYF